MKMTTSKDPQHRYQYQQYNHQSQHQYHQHQHKHQGQHLDDHHNTQHNHDNDDDTDDTDDNDDLLLQCFCVESISCIYCAVSTSACDDNLLQVIDTLACILCISPGTYPKGDDAEETLHADAQGGVSDWLHLAKVLDRLMIVLFSVLTVLIAFIFVSH